MKALIMAAGKGSRISDKIGGIPKSTLTLDNGKPLIRRAVENMLDMGIRPVLCVGYRKEMIMEALAGLEVKYYNNPFYSITNNIVSLWFARDEFRDEDVLLTSADLYYPKEFLSRVMAAPGDLAMTVDSSRNENGDFYFSVKDGIIQEYGLASIVKAMIEEYIEMEKFDRYFEDMIISMNMQEKRSINFVDVKGSFWREFDFYEDYEAILDYERKHI